MTVWIALLALSAFVTTASALVAAFNLSGLRRPNRRGVDADENANADAGPGANADAKDRSDSAPLATICIPARNEASNLEACVAGALSQRGPAIEVLVYDDHSSDGTGDIARRLCERDPRVRLCPTVPLPEGWNGKQHACQRMGEAARGEWLLFTDADVRFHAGVVAAALEEASHRRAELISTFPRQITESMLERLVVPLIHFLLLSYLPLAFMRRSMRPSASAGCGQFLFVRRDAWRRAGGHAAFRDSMHDGIRLPRAVRAAGGRSDLFDGTDLVECRMYRGAAACWRGFAKNAYEGLGSPVALVAMSAIHLVGHLLPWVWLAVAIGEFVAGRRIDPIAASLAVISISAALGERFLLAKRFRQSWLGAALHPVGVLLMTAIQWHSFLLHASGRREWRGRMHAPLQGAGRSGMISRHG